MLHYDKQNPAGLGGEPYLSGPHSVVDHISLCLKKMTSYVSVQCWGASMDEELDYEILRF
jgi:hypothetical protein